MGWQTTSPSITGRSSNEFKACTAATYIMEKRLYDDPVLSNTRKHRRWRQLCCSCCHELHRSIIIISNMRTETHSDLGTAETCLLIRLECCQLQDMFPSQTRHADSMPDRPRGFLRHSPGSMCSLSNVKIILSSVLRALLRTTD